MELVELSMFTEDVRETESFFRRLLGEAPEASGDGFAVFETNGVDLLVHATYDDSEAELPPEDHVAFAVEDVDATFERLARDGLDVFRGPAEYEWGRSAYLRDPSGRLVEVTER